MFLWWIVVLFVWGLWIGGVVIVVFVRMLGGDELENILNDLISKVDRIWKYVLMFFNFFLLYEVLYDFIMCVKEIDLFR